MKILLSTPIYPPEIGGPAQYVQRLKRGLNEERISADVFSYNDLKGLPQPIRFLFYFLKIALRAGSYDIIYAFNIISCGIPCYFASKVLNKKLVMRIGGDFLWERAVESGKTNNGITSYYDQNKNFKEKIWINIIKVVLRSVDLLIFTTDFQRKIYIFNYKLDNSKTTVVANPFPEVSASESKTLSIKKQFLYAGRFIKLKNLANLIDVFSEFIKQNGKEFTLKLVGEGPEKNNLEAKINALGMENRIFIEKSLSHEKLMREIKESYLCVLPSLSEISPNFALECIKLKKPLVITRETGIYELFGGNVLFFDPGSKQELKEGFIYLSDAKNYSNYLERMGKIDTSYSWPEVLQRHISLLKNLL